MKRHRALQPLSRDHHIALTVALKLRRATETDADEVREAFLAFWTENGAGHFRVEEDVLLPAFAEHGDPDDPRVVTMLLDHVRIRAQARAIARGGADVDALHTLGSALERHVRLEEREVFPLIEEALSPAAAEALVNAVEAAERSS